MILRRTPISHVSCIWSIPERAVVASSCCFCSMLPQPDSFSLIPVEDPIEVCTSLWVNSFSSPRSSIFHDLTTPYLSKLDLWVLAYQRCCAHVTGRFPPRGAIQSYTLNSILSLRNAVVENQFKWANKQHQILRSPNDKPSTKLMSKTKLRAMLESTDPCFQDHVVQEVLLMVLEPIFEARFSKRSHAFRPGRNAHTVIRTIRSSFSGYLWFLRGDLSEILDDVDANVLIGCVEKIVRDRRVLDLITTALRRPAHGRMMKFGGRGERKKKENAKKKATKKKILKENEPKPDPYWLKIFFGFSPEEAAKVPHYGYCGVLSPFLANVCLNELDQMMEEKIADFFIPNKLDSIWKTAMDAGCHNPSWPEFAPSGGKEMTRRMDYIRYGGHFLIGIRGPRVSSVQLRRQIIEFCDANFHYRPDNSKLVIEHVSKGILFLDHKISHRVIYPTLRYTTNRGHIMSAKGIGTLLSVTACLEQCVRQFRKLELVKGQKDPEPLPCNPMLYSGQAHTNAQMNKFLEAMADWYRYADNRKKAVGFCAYVIRSSLAKLYAARYRLKSRAKVYRMSSRNLSRPLRENSNNSAPEYSDLLRMGLVDVIEGVRFSRMSMIPSCDYALFPPNWMPDHERALREYIKLQDPQLFCDMHRSLTHSLLSPQDELSEILWDFKTLGVRRRGSSVSEQEQNHGPPG